MNRLSLTTRRAERAHSRLDGSQHAPRMAGAALLFCVVLVLGGCASATGPMEQHHYALGELAPPPAAAQRTMTNNGKVLGITQITVPPWLAGTGFFYRLAYDENNRLAAYAYSDWVAPPATLLEPLIRDALASASGWQAVVGPGAPAAVDASLYLRLGNFSQVFGQPQQSFGVIELTATLIASHSEQVLAQKDFRVQVAAPTPDAQGGAKALARASRQLVVQLQRWVQSAAVGQR